MPLAIIQVDAFTNRPFAGNPAAVCVLDGPVDPAWMQHVAAEMNLAETAFLVPDGQETYSLRWFTPAVEVDLCGHATIAAAHVLWELGRLDRAALARFSTRSGLLTARLGADGWITLDFPAQPLGPVLTPSPGALYPTVFDEIAPSLGLEPSVFVAARTGGADFLVEVASARAVRSIRPDFGLLARFEVRGIVVTARADATDGAGIDFISRFFAPRFGVNEDPVTGSAHCALGPYWSDKLGKTSLVGYQASSRGGIVRVTVAGDRVFLGGQAVTVLRGELTAGVDSGAGSPTI